LVISGEFSSGFSEEKTNGPKMSRANQEASMKNSQEEELTTPFLPKAFSVSFREICAS